MPNLESNRAVWSRDQDWSEAGDEWSRWWGGTHAMWVGALLPRLGSFVPTGTILEIAPGYGRWTQYLIGLADRLVLVDLTGACIDHCRKRFAAADNVEYHVNDGRSLAMIEDGSVDFTFSFDSLVHVDADILGAYLTQLAVKLSPDGVGVIHHSNAGHYRRLSAFTQRVPVRLRRPLVRRGWLLDLAAWRDGEVTAEEFRELCSSAGLSCVGQESISWEHGRFLTDTISVFTRPGSRFDRPTVVCANPGFTDEGRRMRSLWAPQSFGLS